MITRTDLEHGVGRLRRSAVKYSALAVLLLGGAACQTTPAPHSGFLSSYQGLAEKDATSLRGPAARRDDTASDLITHIYIQPAVLALAPDTPLTLDEQTMVRREVDRQICYEVSERFTVIPEASPQAGVVRTAIVRINPTNRFGSAASAAAGFFIPVPVVKFRAPMTTGGLAVESEMLGPDGSQVAALAWSRDAEIVGRVEPSLSRVGDALQLAEPMGDAVGEAFATKARPAKAIADPDPCAQFGPRRDIGRMLATGLIGAGTGLYVPQVAGAGAAEARPAKPTAQPKD